MCALTEGGPVSGFLGSLKRYREVGIREMGDGKVHLPGVRRARPQVGAEEGPLRRKAKMDSMER